MTFDQRPTFNRRPHAFRSIGWICALAVAFSLQTGFPTGEASANTDAPRSAKPLQSTCLATVDNLRDDDIPVRFASFTKGTGSATPGPTLASAAANKWDVRISYQGHSTYLIETPGGEKIATDYAGWMTDQVLPTAVTMNRAHSSHYTDNPDPKIKHIFRGWGDGQTPANYSETVGDTLVRNVTTDILRWGNRQDGNSIFIFEVAGLCIGHLGHLHHKLTEDHYAKIGRLDVVMIPVDGGLTMSHVSAKNIIQRLRSSLILPMHVRSFDAMPRFLSYLDNAYPVERKPTNAMTVSLRSLPSQPTVVILAGVDTYAGSFD